MALARAGSCSGQCHQIAVPNRSQSTWKHTKSSSQLPCSFTHSRNLGMMPAYSGLVRKLCHAPRRFHIFQERTLG